MSPYYKKLRSVYGKGLLIMPSVAAVIRDEADRLLLIEMHDGNWSLPAGAIEPGETPEQAVAREVKEETGMICTECRLLALLGGSGYRYTYSNGDQVEYLVALYRCAAKEDGEPTDVQETRSVSYFAREAMPGLALPYDLDLLFQ
ncbi:NUDIX domain-containing protein [Verrucomicrobium sp. BvORR034]|uniref:NUDIX domain-containing protein n=1 Tax=Verrucomicrobium sp. BvORR034 TaxID=1396418 RepID=UPI00067976E6|nr:NUDIX domain-containing protein [Verrucomicrobium sp. BvORR034]